MKLTHNGKRYDTDKCKHIAELDHHNYNNNYTGTTYLGIASDGQLIKWRTTNGQDLYAYPYAEPLTLTEAQAELEGDNWAIDDALAVQHGLITIVA